MISAKRHYLVNSCVSGSSIGRPPIKISTEQLQLTHSLQYTASQMANHFKCSKSTVYRRSKKENLSFKKHYTVISEDELKIKMEEIRKDHPHIGSIVSV